jgi:hypothetical protein
VTVVSNSTPLIHLSAVSDLSLLRRLFALVTIPAAVRDEVVTSGAGRPGAREIAEAIGSWIRVEPVRPSRNTHLEMERQKLQLGEVQAIELAQALPAEILLMDERRAVEFARSLGLTVFRTGTVYVAAKRAGLIDSVRTKLDALRAGGFWLKDQDYAAIVRLCGEL